MKKIPKRNLYKMLQTDLISSILVQDSYTVFATRFQIYSENIIPKCFISDDLLRKNYFYGFYPCQTGIIKWSCPINE